MRVKDTEAIGAAVGPRGRVKICGITRSEDGILAARLGEDAVGLVFHPKSPRVVGVERARAIVAAHPPCRELVIPGPSRIPCAGCGAYVAERVGARGMRRHDWVGEQS